MAVKDIFADPRYPDFVERYHADPLRFAVEVCGFIPSYDQVRLFNALKPYDAHVSVVSGTGTGKTSAFGRIVLWHLLCFPLAVYDGKTEIGSNTYIGAPKVQQVADGVWKEVEDTRVQIMNGPHAWILDYINISKTRIEVKGYGKQWFITQIALNPGSSVSIAGKHRYWQMVIVDEAAGVSDDHFKVINGTQTQPGNRTLLASQGVSNTGFFYDTHHRLSSQNGGIWTALRFNSERSPFVTLQWLSDLALQAGGRNSVEYKVRALGLFAQDTSNYLLTREQVETIFNRGPIIDNMEPWGYVVLSDVGAGEYRDESVCWVARIVGFGDLGPDALRVEFVELPICSNEKSEIDLPGDLMEITLSKSNATLAIDAGGIGMSVCKRIERNESRSLSVFKINWGAPCFKNEYKDRYFNQRACAQVRFRDAIKQGRVSVLADLDNQTREKIIDQGSRLPYHWAEAGKLRYVIEKKEEMRKKGIRSPDLIDAMSFAFMEGLTFVPADEGIDKSGYTAGKRAIAHAADMFGDD